MKLQPGQVYEVRPGESVITIDHEENIVSGETFLVLSGPVKTRYVRPHYLEFTYIVLHNGTIMKIADHRKDFDFRIRSKV